MESNTASRECIICGTPFLPHPASAHRQVTCSPDCRRENRRRVNTSGHLDHIRIAGDLVTCECGQTFPREKDRLGRGTSRRLCPTCRVVDSRARDMATRLNLPPDARRCASCGCLTDPALGGAQPGVSGKCEPCTTWDRKMSEKVAREMARRPLYTFGPYGAETGKGGGKALERQNNDTTAARIAPQCTKPRFAARSSR